VLLIVYFSAVHEPHILPVRPVEGRALDIFAVHDYILAGERVLEKAPATSASGRPKVGWPFEADEIVAVPLKPLAYGYETRGRNPHGSEIFTIHDRKGNKLSINTNNPLDLLRNLR